MTNVVLSIAGHDPTGGAGLAADVDTLSRLGLHTVTVPTALTEQDTSGCHAVHPLDPALVDRMLQRTLEDFGDSIKAIKVGMLGTAEIADRVYHRLRHVAPPIVLDPLFHPTEGVELFPEGETGIAAMLQLAQEAVIITPNAHELMHLLHMADEEPRADRITELAAQLCAITGAAILAKGGHVIREDASAAIVDILVDGARVASFTHPPQPVRVPHGTGCALSSAIAGHLALGLDLKQAVSHAIAETQERIKDAFLPGKGRPLLG